METKKIALACFIGGALVCIVALHVAPHLWWLGIIAGMAGGYFGYEFRSVLRAFPIAWRETCRTIGTLWKGFNIVVQKFFKAVNYDRPFGIIGLVFSLIFLISTAITLRDIGKSFFVYDQDGRMSASGSVLYIFCIIGIAIHFCPAAYLAMKEISTFLIAQGARLNGCCWPEEKERNKESCDGLVTKPMTLSNFLCWFILGISRVIEFLTYGVSRIILDFLAWAIAKIFLVIGCCLMVIVICPIKLIVLIHSHKRILCAVDGALGGTVAYLLLSPSAHSFGERIFLVLCGGLMGAVFGILNWEIVSAGKRFLRNRGLIDID